MSSLSLMEWNTKPPTNWDWENLIMVSANAEHTKKLTVTEWATDGERRIDSQSLNSSGSGSGNGGSGSDLELASLSKNSMSASINSSSNGDVKMVKTTGISSTFEASVGSSESLLGLKLGKRIYFEDVCGGSNAKTSSFSATTGPGSSVSPPKKSKSTRQASLAPRCQVEGCNLDLSSAKDYHRKHRVCEIHSKCPKVTIAGLERRFCQQCSRFHYLSEFDGKKRSCRKRLSDHNARRRKPHPARLSSSFYDERQRMSLVWNRNPLVQARPYANLTWEGMPSSKFTITKEHAVKPAQVGGIDRHSQLPSKELAASIPIHLHDSTSLLPSKAKGPTAEVLNRGLEESIISPNVDATQDLHRALSLLSTNSWGSYEPKSISDEQPTHTSHTGMPQSVLDMPQGLPMASSDYWRRIQQQSIETRVHNFTSQDDNSSYFQEFQPLRTPYDSSFY